MDLLSFFLFLILLLVVVKASRLFAPRPVSAVDKAILVTGCDSGFGFQLALRAVDEGFHVFAGVLRAESGDGAVARLGAKGCDVVRLDVSDQKSVDEALAFLERRLTERRLSLHGIVNNAGVNLSVGPVEWAAPESVSKVIDVNTVGVVRVTRTFLPLIRASKGRIVNVCSLGAHMPLPEALPYSMAKVATFMFSRGLRIEMKPFGVKVSSISPFYYTTNLTGKENVKRSLEKTWSEATTAAKNDYGQDIYDEKMKLAMKDVRISRPNTKEVIDCMVDALLNENPKCDYVPDFLTRVLIFVFEMMPLSFGEYILLRAAKMY